ncbi:MAG: anaerobic ribonucleoside-triphosphate reductase activating protein [Candidatus Nealsonbacteria bacterium]
MKISKGVKIGGLQKVTLIDYPGKIACTVFLIGCNFKCPWCYSSELVLPEKIKKQPKIPKKDFFDFLKKRKGLLEGVVICGGEPTINKDLPEFIKKIKKLGYLVKLDTNGSNPKMLKRLIDKKLIDYVAMDVKLSKKRYPQIFGKKVRLKDIEQSIKILKKEKIDSEFRTTVIPTILDKKDILDIVQWIGPAKKYYLQNFRPEKTIDPKFEKIKPYSEEYLLEIQKAIAPFFEVCQVK